MGTLRHDEIAKHLGTSVLGKMPIDPDFAEKADGFFAAVLNPYLQKAVEAVTK